MCSDTVDGFLVIDKHEGKTSAFIDFICKKILNAKKAGHIGTLDPFATGVLVVAINNGTKLIPYIQSSSKIYEFTVKFGEKTDTGDKTGKVVLALPKIPMASELEGALEDFMGEISQSPHPFSAVKVGGTRAYKIARRGEVPVLNHRQVSIYNLELLEQVEYDTFRLRASVSPGTYIRSLCESIAKQLGTVGHVQSLRRTMDGQFSVTDAISVDYLRGRPASDIIIPLTDVALNITKITISHYVAAALSLGQTTQVDGIGNGRYLAASESGYLGIVDILGEYATPKKLLSFPNGSCVYGT
ncbi:MAG: tRNA pseudouridine(55) synthase TruB [Holosporales bacterium]|jgi:tRNA pseudouridine55 synthase|nr:tRNA pseudouridine(55) synthase TruB [Holosporales bacterium]